ncbi:hypothetical protein KNE206_65340 [Kitasatospora sp. NE20-6]|uniref:hypothetical protein n=1 Tax=Kitasatospora sp. NE20-6 TaxID=2859066 RepID=UPI0034DBA907
MRISGWIDLDGHPRGVPLRTHDYPRWLRAWLRIPLVDRFAHPHVVRINATLPPDRAVMAAAFSYHPTRKPAKRRTLYRNRLIRRPDQPQ